MPATNMRSMMIILLLITIGAPSVNSLKCWLCRATENPKSFAECNAVQEEQNCPTKKGEISGCGMFVFKNSKGILIHAKSCIYQSYCGANGTFCKNIAVGVSDCRLECCNTELCNNKDELKPTTPAPTTLKANTEKNTEELTTPETTTKIETTTEKETTPTQTELPTHDTTAPDYDDEDDDCSWIDAGSTHLISGMLLLTCAMAGMLPHPLLN